MLSKKMKNESDFEMCGKWSINLKIQIESDGIGYFMSYITYILQMPWIHLMNFINTLATIPIEIFNVHIFILYHR